MRCVVCRGCWVESIEGDGMDRRVRNVADGRAGAGNCGEMGGETVEGRRGEEDWRGCDSLC